MAKLAELQGRWAGARTRQGKAHEDKAARAGKAKLQVTAGKGLLAVKIGWLGQASKKARKDKVRASQGQRQMSVCKVRSPSGRQGLTVHDAPDVGQGLLQEGRTMSRRKGWLRATTSCADEAADEG